MRLLVSFSSLIYAILYRGIKNCKSALNKHVRSPLFSRLLYKAANWQSACSLASLLYSTAIYLTAAVFISFSVAQHCYLSCPRHCLKSFYVVQGPSAVQQAPEPHHEDLHPNMGLSGSRGMVQVKRYAVHASAVTPAFLCVWLEQFCSGVLQAYAMMALSLAVCPT